MNIFFVLSAMFINLNRIEITTVSSSYDLVQNYGIRSNYDRISKFQNKPSMLMCIIECNRIPSCTVAIYDSNAKTCEIYSQASPIHICKFKLSPYNAMALRMKSSSSETIEFSVSIVFTVNRLTDLFINKTF